MSYTDVYDFSSKKQSLKKFEIELGIHHQELGLPWDKPVPEELWTKVAEYCDNDVIATEATFNARKADFTARQILADVAGMSVNDTTNSLTTRIIFGNNRKPQDQFNYRFMGDESQIFDPNADLPFTMGLEDYDEFTQFDKNHRPIFPGYTFEGGKSVYRGEEVGEGGYVYSEPGMYSNIALLDIASMHPSSIVAEELFGPEYTKRFNEILQARIAIKHKDFDKAKKMLGGALAKYLTDENAAADLAQALKIAINSVYGLTSAGFENPFRDNRNKDNIVAKRGALFMVNLKHAVQSQGFIVAHIKTDSIKIPDATPEIIKFVTEYGKLYGYSFNNTLLIAMQKPEATYVAGYTSWQRNFDRQVMKGEKGIKILAPAPYKAQEEREKIDPLTQKPVIGADGKAVTETVEVLRPAFKVVSVFDVSQTDGKELPDIIVDELKGTVENYEAFFDALRQESPVPISFEDIPGGAKGFFSPVESRIAIQEGMSEIQTVKTAIHEIAHAKLHAVKPDEKAAPEDKKDRHTKEVEAESVAYTVCQRYGIETSDYSFGYIAGWSSGKETKELKSSLDTIRKTAAEMIEGIDAKLKVLLAEKAQSAEMEVEAPVKEAVPEEKPEVPIYRETANYAYEADELESYRASLAANVECRRAIEAAISSYYGDNRLDADAAVKSVLEQFSPERVRYVLANTIQQKDFDGRIPQPLKEWAKTVDVCPENASRFLVDKPNPGLTALFVDAFRQQTEPQKEAVSEKTEERDPEVVAWENDEITSIEVKTVEVKSPFAPLPEEAAKAPKAHRLTAEEKEIKAAVMDTLKGQIAYNNDGMRASYRASRMM